MKHVITAAMLLVVLPGCASIIEGRSQMLSVNTSPHSANCTFTRDGETLGQIAETPGRLKVKKTRDDIDVVCNKPGYEAASYHNESDMAGWFWGNILLGGLVGMGIDWGTGAYNKYDAMMNISMSPLPAGAPHAASSLPPIDSIDAASRTEGAPVLIGDTPMHQGVLRAPAVSAEAPAPLSGALPIGEVRPAPEPLPAIAIPSGASANQSGWGRGASALNAPR